MKPFADTMQSVRRQRLFEYLLQKEGITVTRPIGRVPRTENLPLSLAQERIWFLEQLQPGTSSYHMGGAVRLQGLLDVPALERALSSIVARHESLRTTFRAEDGKPMQVIGDGWLTSLAVEDLGNLVRNDAETELQRLISLEVERPFDLDRGPLLRIKLFRLTEQEYILLLVIHHIVGDAWSMGVLFHDLAQFYSAFLGNNPAPLPELPVQYVDYAQWQREWLQADVVKRQTAYWKKQLGGKLPILQLPTDRSRPPVQTFRGAHLTIDLPKHLLDGLKRFSKREGVTLFMTLLSVFQTLLTRYTGQEDVLVGSPIAGRTRPETESLIGLFINTVVLRTDLGGNPSFRELLHRVRNVVLGAFEHQDLPFGRLVAELQPERDLSHSPVFQVMFVLQNTPLSTLCLPNLVLTPIKVENDVSKVDLTLEVMESEDGLTCTFEYTDLFEFATIKQMIAAFQLIIEKLLGNPEQQIWSFSLVDEAARTLLARTWNETETAFSAGRCIHELIEHQAFLSPHSIAVTFGEQSLSYGELNARSNQLAHYLRSRGVQSKTLVGVFMERSLDMIVSLLGILKAGGAYVPLDPAYPAERVSFMIADSRMSVMLTRQEELQKLTGNDVFAICLDRDWKYIAEQSQENLRRSAVPEDLAYVMYTSGSTGRPKGVLVEHRSVVNFLESMRREPGIVQDDILLAVTTLSFDIAGLELYLPLTVGARITIVPREVALDAMKLGDLLFSSRATVMQATPTTWRMLIEAGWEGNPQLKILCGGERLARDLADQLLSRGGSLWNLYGPTETTVWSAVHRVAPGKGPIVIGKAIANTQMYVLDPHLNLVPIGVPGELHIGGIGLARGYLNQPELTAEKFIADPFASTSGSRLYKTGDLVRYLPDGTLEFLGRIDQQVKIRGFRIELGEIETILRRHPDVQESVVVVKEDSAGDRRLVAYFVPAREPGPATSDLRACLQQHLPDHMLPSAFVSLTKLPLTPNGKVDRRALPAPEQRRPESDASYDAPRNEIEKRIASIWQEVLNVKQVGRSENFFDLGGHSLLVVRVHSAIRKSFPTNVSMTDMFRYPTVTSLAEYLQRGAAAPSAFPEMAGRVALRRESVTRQRQARLFR